MFKKLLAFIIRILWPFFFLTGVLPQAKRPKEQEARWKLESDRPP
jgi:hypothetical protein